MATATAPVVGLITLTGSTPNPDSAPTTYILKTAGTSFPLTTFTPTRTLEIDSTRTRIFFGNESVIIPTDQVASFLSALSSAKTQVNTDLKKAATTATTTTTNPEIVVTAPKKIVAPTSDVPISIATLDPGPIKVKSSPLEIEAIGLNGKPTGEKIIINPPDAGSDPNTPNDVPISILTMPETPLVNTDQINAEIANIQFDPPQFSTEYSDIYEAESQATAQDQANFKAKADWRVRLTLAPESQYLYNDPEYAGILKPLKETDGVIFPYTPSIAVNYTANYEQTNLVHSNYKIFQYSGSAVEQVSISCDFTCQDTYEANYLLAVIHFFRSMTKMFYGQDTNPKNGTPPPLCYMFGMGGYQFAAHPLAIGGFSYNLPSDVDYIKTTSASPAGAPVPAAATADASATRLSGTGVTKGGQGPGPKFNEGIGNETVTWVPTKIQLSITCYPIMSRNAISNQFSLRRYGSGDLVLGTRKLGGGMW